MEEQRQRIMMEVLAASDPLACYRRSEVVVRAPDRTASRAADNMLFAFLGEVASLLHALQQSDLAWCCV